MNIFVTGGTGYLGSTLISRLLREDEVSKVIALARNSERVRDLLVKVESVERLEFVKGNVQHHNYNLSNIDAVIHLACEHDPFICERNSGEVIDINIGGTQRLIEAVRKFHVPYFIFISQFGVYGEQKTMPLREDLVPRPNATKFLIAYASEVISRGLANSSSRYAILRLVHMFGIGTLPSRIKGELTRKFAKASCNGGNLTIYGNGNQTVDLVHVKDVSDCIYRLLISSATAWNETYNVGGGRAISINKLADIFIDKALTMGLKSPSKTYIEFENYIESKGLSSVWLDITKSRKKLGWTPSITIEEGAIELIRACLNSGGKF